MKNIDSVNRTLCIKAFCIPFPFLDIVGFVFGGITGLFLAAMPCLLISALTVFVSGRLGGIAGGNIGKFFSF